VAQARAGAQRGGGRPDLRRYGCFSFYPTKNLGALAMQGALTTNDSTLAAKLAELGHMDGAENTGSSSKVE
jgi:dTDP-4-amino-4,6-dideoxygalactose transaminase